MAKLVFGNTKQTVVPAVVKEKQPVIDTLNVAPTTSAQTITAPSGTDGYSPVNVSAVDSSIDANIVAGNIKSGVSILGVNGSVVELNGTTTSVTPTTSAQTITPTAPNNGFTEISVSAVTSAIDSNIQAGNIKQGVTILGVAGNYSGITPTGTLPITTNGIYDVTNYASADVQVPSSAPAYYSDYTNNNGVLSNGTMLINTFDGINQINVPYFGARVFFGKTLQNQNFVLGLNGGIKADSVFYYTFTSSNIKKADFSGITYIEGNQCFSGCFSNCFQLEEVDISGLERIGKPNEYCGSQAFQNTFINNPNLTEFSFTNLKYLYGSLSQVFQNLTHASFTTIRFPVLEKCHTGGVTSQDYSVLMWLCANNVRHIYFNAFKSDTFGGKVACLSQMLSSSVNGCTLHFPSNLDPQNGSTVLSSLTGYPNFGGTNTVLAFDLPATE